jgi:hypothetical protein
MIYSYYPVRLGPGFGILSMHLAQKIIKWEQAASLCLFTNY